MYYLVEMERTRRILALALLLLINFPLIGLAFVSDLESKLPACCRRAGRHKCVMPGGSHSGPSFENTPCPAFPGTHAAPATLKFGLAENATSVRIALIAQTDCLPAIDSNVQFLTLRVTWTRGPPPFAS